jgi:hypothetical protein
MFRSKKHQNGHNFAIGHLASTVTMFFAVGGGQHFVFLNFFEIFFEKIVDINLPMSIFFN